ncbi:MAG: hypothetical protein QXI19_06595 [Candidatus Caldarchaeum sp.]
MKGQISKALVVLVTILASALPVLAGVLVVTAPVDGAFVGGATTISFRIEGGVVEVTVRAVITAQVGGSATTLTTRVTPDHKGRASGSMTWNPSRSFPEGLYTIEVSAEEPGNSYNTVTLSVTLDRKEPRLLDFSPQPGTFLRTTIRITGEIMEPNLEEWKVTVNDEDIPNNTGTGNTIDVFWDPSNIEEDGPQTIKIKMKDRAQNEATKEIEVFLDRAPPQINVLFPRSGQAVRPNTVMGVAFDVVDSRSTSVDVMAITVEIRDMSDNLIRRVARMRYREVNETTSRWEGRALVRLPGNVTSFQLVVTAIDKAGNPAVVQRVPLVVGRGR